MEKIIIKNRKGQRVVVVVEKTPNQEGLAFVMHGLGGFKEQSHIKTFAEAFKNNDFTVVRFDTTNTFGESDGDYADATITNYYEDLEDVIEWTKSQDFYHEPFYLAGHSLGGISTALFAQKHPDKVKGLAPISTVISGKLSFEARGKEKMDEIRRLGWDIRPAATDPNRIKKLKYSHWEDRLKYDLLDDVNKLTMPVLMIVGSLDEGALPKHQKILYNALPGPKEFHIIEGGPHTFVDEDHLKQIYEIFNAWIKKTNT